MTKGDDEGWWRRVMTKDGEVVTNGSDDPGAMVT